MMLAAGFKPVELSLLEKLRLLNWPFVLVVAWSRWSATARCIRRAAAPTRRGRGGTASAGHGLRRDAGGGADRPPLLVSLRLRAYGAALLGLIAVEFAGQVAMGAQRWLDLGLFQLQPSEVMKIALVMALARYFHSAYLEDVARPLHLITPSLLALMPARWS